MDIRNLGHSCLLVECAGTRVLFDPGVFSTRFEGLTSLDAIVITHAHVDHVDVDRLPALTAGNPSARLLAEPEIAEQLRGRGLEVQTLAAGQKAEVGSVTLTAAGGRHAVVHPDIPRIGNVGILLTADGEPCLFHPGDAYDTVPAGVDVLALPLQAPWAAGRETIDFARAVRPGVLFPIHDGLLAPAGRGVYLRAMEPLFPAGTAVRDLGDGQRARF